ncbi:hypothetical protein RCO48_11775 [Peribacillus frigoritolerans]|nr:hypothetical protein [Peribacillus frigoritolerans]
MNFSRLAKQATAGILSTGILLSGTVTRIICSSKGSGRLQRNVRYFTNHSIGYERYD